MTFKTIYQTAGQNYNPLFCRVSVIVLPMRPRLWSSGCTDSHPHPGNNQKRIFPLVFNFGAGVCSLIFLLICMNRTNRHKSKLTRPVVSRITPAMIRVTATTFTYYCFIT
jgi:hypothetical protein